MSKNPKHRPPNTGRIESMARHYVAAWETVIIRDDELIEELYSGKEFPPIEGRDLSHFDKLQLAIDEIILIYKYCLIDWYEEKSGKKGLLTDWRKGLSDEQDITLDWHEEHSKVFEPLSRKPRGDRMLVYGIAAATFNNQLAIDQAGNESIGLEPTRLSEKPTNADSLRRALSRPSGIKALAEFEEFCRKHRPSGIKALAEFEELCRKHREIEVLSLLEKYHIKH